MAVMIQLHLPAGQATLPAVQQLPGLRDLPLDERFGVVCIDPKRDLYVVRTDKVDGLDARRAKSPEIQGAFGDVRISTT